MNGFGTLVMVGAAATLWAIGMMSAGAMQEAFGLASAGLAAVAFAAQWRRFDEGRHRVYRPVYVRSGNVQPRVRSYDD